jgi:predicted transcriptional regulator
MTGVRARGEDVRRFILRNVDNHPTDISKAAAAKFGIARQAVNLHLQRLVAESAITESGHTRNRIYKLATATEWHRSYPINSELAEDRIWREDVRKVLGKV